MNNLDTFDLINLALISVVLVGYLINHPQQRFSALLVSLLFYLTSLSAANRVLGYPDRKWWFFEFSFYVLYPILGFLIVWQLKTYKLWNKIVLFPLILFHAYYPVCLLPVALIRNSWANNATQYVIQKWRPASFITRVTQDTLFVVQMVKDKMGQKKIHVINYYWDRKKPPVLLMETELLSGGGTMETQTLNQPYVFILQMMNLF